MKILVVVLVYDWYTALDLESTWTRKGMVVGFLIRDYYYYTFLLVEGMRSLERTSSAVVVDFVCQTFRGGEYISLMVVDSALEMESDCYASCGGENVELEKLVVRANDVAVSLAKATAKTAYVPTLLKRE